MKKITLQAPLRMKGHIYHKSGKAKTVCVTACLTALGVPFENFQVTGTLAKPNFMGILNRHGIAARSRKSQLPKGATVGQARKYLKKLDEDCHYMVVVNGATYCHMMLLDSDGTTLVDTDWKKIDKRKIHSIHAVTKAA